MPKRDISSLGVMGWGLEATGNSSVAAQWVFVKKGCVLLLTFCSPLGLRTKIWTRYCREIARSCVARLFAVHHNWENYREKQRQQILFKCLATLTCLLKNSSPKHVKTYPLFVKIHGHRGPRAGPLGPMGRAPSAARGGAVARRW